MASVGGTSSSSSESVYNTDPNIKLIQSVIQKTETGLKKEFQKLDNKNLPESEKQEILFNIQQQQNLMERMYALVASMIESSHRIMMAIINKIGS